MPTLPPPARHDLTDAEWALLAPLLPAPPRRGRPRTWGIRSLLNGIFFRIRTGCPWPDVHERHGPWWRVYALFVHLRADGVWTNVHTRLLTHAQEQGKLSWRSVPTPRPLAGTSTPPAPGKTVSPAIWQSLLIMVFAAQGAGSQRRSTSALMPIAW
ncbi:transposase [Corynebacterium occultum]|uniref:transposase n=1 Tax=Corynebacterium occultum TaxID=2675219 RepID=UPI001E604387|nr:transposase [Corynebacterium occultum]